MGSEAAAGGPRRGTRDGTEPRTASARACANIALIKYWGKRDAARNLPQRGSLSLTLAELVTETTVTLDPAHAADRLTLDGVAQGEAATAKATAVLDALRREAGVTTRASVVSINRFPTAAGLASSASGFAALAVAGAAALGVQVAPERLSAIARLGSGSACRSLFGGFVEWVAGRDPEGWDSHGVPVLAPGAWDVRMLVAVCEAGPKPVGSRDAMNHTVRTSSAYPGWIQGVDADLAEAKAAIARRDLEALGTIAEANALGMHATMIAARPPVLYWLPASVALLRAVWDLRAGGTGCWATMDAGPNVKVLCAAEDAPAVETALRAVAGVREVRVCRPGPGALVVPEPVGSGAAP